MAIHRHRWVSALLVMITVLATGATSLAQDQTGGPEPNASPAATPAAVALESQVFVMSPWRFTLVSARFGDAIPAVELGARTGRDWAVVVLDVMNWSEEDADLRWRDFGLKVAGELEGGGFAPQTSQDVASTLGVEPEDVSAELTIGESETVRVALVFQINDGGRDPALSLNGLDLPLADTLSGSPDPNALPPVTAEPELESERVVRVADGRTIRVGGGSGRPVRLAGVDAPSPEECFGSQSTDQLTAMAGEEVFIERVSDDEAGLAYIWVDAPDGTRRLLNYEIIATGYAAARDSGAPRVQSWLAEAEHRARYGHLGLWFGCSGPHGVARPEEPEPRVLEVEVAGVAGEYEVWTAWAPEIVATHHGGAVAFFSAAAQEEEGAGDLRLYWSRLDPTTGRWSRGKPIPGGRVQMGASAIVDGGGRVHVVYSDRRADETDEQSRLRYITENGDGGWTEPIDLAPERAAGHQLSPSLTIDASG
ncbi:MAG: thermonuclease family protein, partial [Thermomicrobiales bacterium]